MPIRSNLLVGLSLILLGMSVASAADEDAAHAFVAAMQRVRLNQPDLPDSPGLETYAIHDYLVAARLRRDLARRPGETLDSDIDAFLKAHAGEPVIYGL